MALGKVVLMELRRGSQRVVLMGLLMGLLRVVLMGLLRVVLMGLLRAATVDSGIMAKIRKGVEMTVEYNQ